MAMEAEIRMLTIIFLVLSGYDHSVKVSPNSKMRRGEGRTDLVVRASDSGSGDPCSILGRVGVLFP